VEFEWDPPKARENIRDHGIDFADIPGLFDNPYFPREDPDAPGEQRFVATGMDGLGRILVVAYTYRPGKIRLFSARKATKKERKDYAQGVRF